MEIQLMLPSPATDFNFESTNTTPYVTAPSTPHRFPNFFYTAPTSPIHSLANAFHENTDQHDDDKDFAFDFTGHLEPPPSISAADELFHGGKIKPLTPVSESPTSRFTRAFSPRRKNNKNFDDFIQAFHQTPGEQIESSQNSPNRRTDSTTKTKITDHDTAFKISDILSEEENNNNNNQRNLTNQSSSLTWYNKWNLKNLLLFRSASEGSARRSKDPVNRYSRIRKGGGGEAGDDVKNSSFRSVESLGSSRRVMRKVSAHEIHYTANRAVAEEMRKKTYLPYKSGLLGCLGFHNNGGGSVHEISRGIASVMKQRGH